jgi:tRNA nucleotidyltransferase (CCA-adding enzyme)
MTASRWEHFAHGADIGVRGIGASREAAFEQAAVALTAVLADPESVRPETAVAISCAGPDDGLLLVDWLNAIIYEMATRSMLFHRFKVEIDGGMLRGTCWGESVDIGRHRPAVEVKGATYTSLTVGRQDDGTWSAECVVDV